MAAEAIIGVKLPPLEHAAGVRAWKRAQRAEAAALTARDQAIRHYRNLGYSAETIAGAFKLSRPRVYQILEAT